MPFALVIRYGVGRPPRKPISSASFGDVYRRYRSRRCGAGYSAAPAPKPAARGERNSSHALVAIGALYEPPDRPADTFRTSLLELMMSVHWGIVLQKLLECRATNFSAKRRNKRRLPIDVPSSAPTKSLVDFIAD